MKLSEIAKLVGGTVEGKADAEVERLGKIEDAVAGDLTFLANPKYAKHLSTTGATAVLVSRQEDLKELRERSTSLTLIRVDDPYGAFAQLIDVFHPQAASLSEGVHQTAVVPRSASLGKKVSIGAHVVLGEGCVVGDGATIWHGTVLGDDVTVGEKSLLYPNVSVREQCRIGKRVIIHSGTVVGSDGFGFTPGADGVYSKIPQRGIVVIEDDVEVGANCTIDRATIGETRIKKGAKLDNLIQVAHNCVIGENTVIAAQAGISGSTRVGSGSILAGQVGLVGHIQLADRTTIGAQSGVHKSVKEPGKTLFGSPAQDIQERLRIEAALRQLPDLLATVRALKREVEELTKSRQKSSSTP